MAVSEEKKINAHQGINVRNARIMRGKNQNDLADELNISQKEISKMEQNPVIEKSILDKIARYLNVDIKYLEEHIPDEVLGSYNTQNNDIETNTVSDQGQEFINSASQQNIETIDAKLSSKIINEFIKTSKEDKAEIKRLYKKIAKLEIFIAKNGLEFPAEE